MMWPAFIQETLMRSLGTSMIHFLWEGVLISLLVLLFLFLAGRHRSLARYIILYTGLIAMFAAFAITFSRVHTRDEAVQETTIVYTNTGTEINKIEYSHNSGLTERIAGYVDVIPGSVHNALAVVWLAGFILLVLRLAGGYYTGYNLSVKRATCPGENLKSIFEEVRKEMGLKYKVQLRIITERISPMVVGIIKPVIIIPISALNNLSVEQTEAIIAHEMAHIKRFDNILLLIQEIIKALLFFHPAVWLLSNEIDRERENCCDDMVTEKYTDSITYIKALTMIQEIDMEGYVPANAAIRQPKLLLRRIKRLTAPVRGASYMPFVTTLFLFLTAAGIIIAAKIKPADVRNRAAEIKQASAVNFFAAPGLTGKTEILPGDTPKVSKKEVIRVYTFDNDTSKEIYVRSIINGDSLAEYDIRIPRGMTINDSLLLPDESFFLSYPKLMPEGNHIIINDSVVIIDKLTEVFSDTNVFVLEKNILTLNDSIILFKNGQPLLRKDLEEQLQIAREEMEKLLGHLGKEEIIISRQIEKEYEEAIEESADRREEMLRQLELSRQQVEEAVKQKQLSEEQRREYLKAIEKAEEQMENAIRQLEISQQQREKALQELEDAGRKIDDLIQE